MFGRYSERRLKRAQQKNQRLKRDIELARKILALEGENEVLSAQILEMERTQRSMVSEEKRGLRKAGADARRELQSHCRRSGEKRIGGYAQSVRARLTGDGFR